MIVGKPIWNIFYSNIIYRHKIIRIRFLVTNTGMPQDTSLKSVCVAMMTYITEKWSLTLGLIRKLKVTQKSNGKGTLGVSMRDWIKNSSSQIRLTDIDRKLLNISGSSHDGRWGHKILSHNRVLKNALVGSHIRWPNDLVNVKFYFTYQLERYAWQPS